MINTDICGSHNVSMKDDVVEWEWIHEIFRGLKTAKKSFYVKSINTVNHVITNFYVLSTYPQSKSFPKDSIFTINKFLDINWWT